MFLNLLSSSCFVITVEILLILLLQNIFRLFACWVDLIYCRVYKQNPISSKFNQTCGIWSNFSAKITWSHKRAFRLLQQRFLRPTTNFWHRLCFTFGFCAIWAEQSLLESMRDNDLLRNSFFFPATWNFFKLNFIRTSDLDEWAERDGLQSDKVAGKARDSYNYTIVKHFSFILSTGRRWELMSFNKHFHSRDYLAINMIFLSTIFFFSPPHWSDKYEPCSGIVRLSFQPWTQLIPSL